MKLIDSNARKKQTIECLHFYIGCEAFDKILLCDGSNYNFSNTNLLDYAKKHKVKLELLSFQQDFDKVAKYGKGYGEGEIMEYLVNNSILFSKSRNFLKVTGRLIVKNIVEITNTIDSAENVHFNIMPSKRLSCVDTRVYVMPTDCYKKHFLFSYLNVNDSINYTYEYCFSDVINNNKIKFECIPETPILCGFSGTDNKQYKKDSTYWTIFYLTRVGLMNTTFAGILLFLLRGSQVILKKLKCQ